jgi:hypothetical protein
MHSQAFRTGLLALALLAVGNVRAQEIRATTVTLTVTDPTGAPIANAHTLAIYGSQFNHVSTDEHGRVSFKMLRGSGFIPVSASGYKNEEVPFDLRSAGDTVDISVALEPIEFKLTSRRTISSNSFLLTTYAQGNRTRVEAANSTDAADRSGSPQNGPFDPAGVTIFQCDQQRAFRLNTAAHEYVSYTLTDRPYPEGTAIPKVGSSVAAIEVDTETIDTGERQNFFGYPARHLITTQIIHREGFPSSGWEKTADGWYIDLKASYSCHEGFGNFGDGFLTLPTPDAILRSDIRYRHTGVEIVGLPVDLTVQTRNVRGDGREFVEQERNEVIELSTAPLDASLFEVPEGFTKVDRLKPHH